AHEFANSNLNATLEYGWSVRDDELSYSPTLTVTSYFFFQAEDGIRARNVTGVQTCALPISPAWATAGPGRSWAGPGRSGRHGGGPPRPRTACRPDGTAQPRTSCRPRRRHRGATGSARCARWRGPACGRS